MGFEFAAAQIPSNPPNLILTALTKKGRFSQRPMAANKCVINEFVCLITLEHMDEEDWTNKSVMKKYVVDLGWPQVCS